jgi:hypothetical protein
MATGTGFFPRRVVPALLCLVLAGCSPAGLGTVFGPAGPTATGMGQPAPTGRAFGKGPVRVALLVPLSGDPALASVGASLANAAQLAVDFIEKNDSIADNITVVLKDTGDSAGGASRAASEAVAEGASLILGPLRADQVSAAGSVARSAGLSVIGFSNNSGAASPGVYLLSVLPEVEMRRAMAFVHAKGKRALAGVFPNTDFGRIHQGAFTQAASELGINARAVYNFTSEAEARTVVQQLAPLIKAGQIDTVFLPDRATAPSFAALFEQAGVGIGAVQVVGSTEWNGDANISNTPWLHRAYYPAVDDAGLQAIRPDYVARFGSEPHALATIAYTAVILANASSLSMSTPKYDRAALTAPSGFNGRDGVFRFFADGRSQYALAIKQVGGASIADPPKL